MTTTPVQHQLLSRLSRHMMSQVFADWEAMVGVRIAVIAEVAVTHPAARMLTPVLRQDCVVVQTRVEGECEGVLTFVFPTDFVIEVVGEMIMLPEEIRKEKRRSGLAPEDVEPFQEMSNLLCGSCNNVFSRMQRRLRVSQSVDDLRVIYSPRDDAQVVAELPAGMLATVRLVVEMGGAHYNVVQTWQRELANEVGDLLRKGR
jgi:chemotaxis protein CheY-P-specific phosphatase CheC